MKKISVSILIILSLILTSCGKPKPNPEEIIKKTQVNILNKVENNVFAKKQGEFKSNLSINVDSLMGKGNGEIVFTGLTNNNTGLVNLIANINFTTPQLSGKILLNSNIITTISKIYIKLNKLNLDIPDPNIQAYSTMIKNVINKWLYIENPNNIKYNQQLKNIKIKNLLNKYSLLKVKKTLKERTYNVELNKENLNKLLIELNKQLIKNYSGDYKEIKNNLNDINLNGILEIKEDNLHFSFSGYLIDQQAKTPIKITYDYNKLQLETPDTFININLKENNSYEGYIKVKKTNIQIPLKGKLNSNEFEININYNQSGVNAKINFYYNINPKNNININLPKNPININNILNSISK